MSPTPSEPYSGRDNLEVMEDAVNYNRWLVDWAVRCLPHDGKILDFGAGSGTLTWMLRDLGLDVVAVEPDSELVRQLEARNIPVVRNLDSIPDGSIAGVASFNVLEHIPDDAAVLRTIHTKLRPSGTLFLYVPAFPVLYSSMDRKVGHVRRYRRHPLRRLLTQCGYRVNVATYADSLGFFGALAYRAAGSRAGTIDPHAVRIYDRFIFPLSRVVDRLSLGTFGKNLVVVAEASSTNAV